MADRSIAYSAGNRAMAIGTLERAMPNYRKLSWRKPGQVMPLQS
jgi:hypothetical protein